MIIRICYAYDIGYMTMHKALGWTYGDQTPHNTAVFSTISHPYVSHSAPDRSTMQLNAVVNAHAAATMD